MRVSDLLIDLNDIYGRLIPGILLLINLYFIINFFIPIFPEKILKWPNEYPSLYILFILILLVIAHITGEFSLYIVFKIRHFFPFKTALEYLEKIDVTKEKEIINFFKSKFNEDALHSTWPLMLYCKDYLLENSFPSYVQARKVEARINLKGGVLFPLIVSVGICFLYRQWIFSIFILAITAVFVTGFLSMHNEEHTFIYKAYYNCIKKIR